MAIYLSSATNLQNQPIAMKNSGIISICLISFYISACNTQAQNTPVAKASEMKISPEITAHENVEKTNASTLENRGPIKLSIDRLPFDYQTDNEKFLNSSSEPSEEKNRLFETPQNNNADPDIKLSGKVFTDNDRLENKDYLNSLDGVQINIKGSFN